MGKTDALQIKRVQLLLYLFIAAILGLLIFRVGYWQIVKADWLKERAVRQWVRQLPIEADRGDILDRNGNVLSVSVSCYSVILQPEVIEEDELDHLVQKLSEVLGLDIEYVRAKATSERKQVWLKRQILPEQGEVIRALELNGVSLAEDKMRYYPLGNFLTQVLGFTSIDGEGLEGIESRFDKHLRGIQGTISAETDRDGKTIPGTDETYTPSVDGNSITLTIDTAIQSYAEIASDQLLTEQHADGVYCVVMNPQTGEILAMVNKPDYDNNVPPRNDIDLLRSLTRNGSISNAYSPGSLFFPITASAALDRDIISVDTQYSCNRTLVMDERTLGCFDEHGKLSLEEALVHECSLSFANAALEMGNSVFYTYLDRYGFGSKTGIEMYGETAGYVTAQKYVKPIQLAETGYGLSLSASPLQLASAYSAMVNGGTMYRPWIVRRITDPEGNELVSNQAQVTGTVISPQTSQLMRDLLSNAVQKGNGRGVSIPGYAVGAYAGTAPKFDDQGEIVDGEYITSFVAAAPLDNPQLVVVMMVDNPEQTHYGSISTAPYIRQFLLSALPYLNIMSNDHDVSSQSTMVVPDVDGEEREQAVQAIERAGFQVIVEGTGESVTYQMPAAGTNYTKGETVFLQLGDPPQFKEDRVVDVPDLSGMTPVEAIVALEEVGLNMRLINSGNLVIQQSPAADEAVYIGSTVAVEFEYVEPVDDEEE